MEDPDFNPPAPPNVTVPVTPVPPVIMGTAWNIQKVAALVRDLAMELYDEPTILAKHGMSQADFARLRENQFFKGALEQERISWHSPQSATRRLALEAAMAVEDALPTVAARMHNPHEPLSDVVSLLKVLSELAGAIGSKAQGAQNGGGGQFKITINLGADTLARSATPLILVNPNPETAEVLEDKPLPSLPGW